MLTHLSRMEFPTGINWSSSFPFKGFLGGNFHFYSNFNRPFSKQTVETLIRRRVLRRLIWFCTVCRCPIKRTLGLNELSYTYNLESFKVCCSKCGYYASQTLLILNSTQHEIYSACKMLKCQLLLAF